MLIQDFHGLCRSPWILQLFAGHYDSTSGAIRIPDFEPAFSREKLALINSLEMELNGLEAENSKALEIAVKIDMIRMWPKGALALCMAAVRNDDMWVCVNF